ncbi:MAG: isopentenyl-diphosphate Delta-isomerase [Tenuifilaceae bacterium]|jgi:isopentenyl-diphosphate delta-isomerase|nr:isopentenyl-diphosphate Delta-isomerase [Tenuifilaceae bacterium]
MSGSIALVDKHDRVIGYGEKYDVHKEGLLHRAFSIFVFNSANELMIHQRAHEKYHSPGLWTNTCCSHLPKGSEMDQAIHVRLLDEMGFDTPLHFVEKFHYRIDFDNGLTENEIDHIYIGFYEDNPHPNSIEVANYKLITMQNLKEDIAKNPDNYTYWLKHIMAHHYQQILDAVESLRVK